jgi:hypothetical protein
MSQIQIDKLESVEAVMNYTEATSARPSFFIYKTEPGEDKGTRVTAKHTIPIYDVRAQMDEVSLDDNGFCFVRDPLPEIDFFDPDQVRQSYYQTCTELVERVTGASRAMAFDHNVRDKDLADQPGVEIPVRYAHNDYTDISSPQRVHDLMGDEAPALLERRYMFINVWRALRGPVLDTPLAVCDASSLAKNDFIPTDLKYRDRTGEIYSFSFSENHRWCFLRDMQDNEVLMLKCFDSATDGPARYTAHSAFRDPSAPADALPRRSIEVRTIAFF